MKGNSPLFTYHGTSEAGDVVYLSNPTAFFENISRRKDIDPNGYVDIVAHGTSKTIQLRHGERNIEVSWRVLAKLVEHTDSLKNKPIRLLSCNTGSDQSGFAQNLANKLGVRVIAPNKVLWCWSDGSHFIASRSRTKRSIPDLRDKGEFVEFVPGGNKKWRR